MVLFKNIISGEINLMNTAMQALSVWKYCVPITKIPNWTNYFTIMQTTTERYLDFYENLLQLS